MVNNYELNNTIRIGWEVKFIFCKNKTYWILDIVHFADPYFVRILNIGSYVYTFFREIALEHLSCGTVRQNTQIDFCLYEMIFL